MDKTTRTNDMRSYRIGDYARYMGVTPDFLKHYEQFRLVSSVARENGYRYYPFSQSFKILECMRLRNYGIPIRDMDVLLHDEDMPDVMRRLDARVDTLRQRIAFEQAVVDEHERMSAWLANMQGKREDWRVISGEATYFLPHTSERNFLKDERIYDVLNGFIGCMPMVKSCMRIRHAPGETLPPQLGRDYAWGLCVPVRVAQALRIPINDAVQTLPPRKLFWFDFCEFEHTQGETNQPGPYAAMAERMRAMNLRPSGDIYMTMLMYTHVGGPSCRYGYFAAPLD